MEIKSSDNYFQQNITDFENITVLVDNKFSRGGATFKKCVFQFSELGSLELNHCNIEECKFFGFSDFDMLPEREGNLTFTNLNLYTNNEISGYYRDIKIGLGDVINHIDKSYSHRLRLVNLKIFNCMIEGQCDTLEIIDSYFTSRRVGSYWNKKIVNNAECKKVTFDDIKINPFYLATKCSDKSSLDLTRATLVDDWSRLRKKYAGISLFIVFILTLIFFLPVITESFFLLLSAKLDSTFSQFNKVPLWKVLFFGGKEGLSALIYSLLTIILLTYNIGRLWMTISIAKLREEENFLKDSNFQLVSIHPEKYKTQLKIDKILKYMFWISLGYSILKLVDTLSIAVPVFT